MKTVIIAIIMMASAAVFAQAERTFIKTLTTPDSLMIVDFRGEVRMSRWDGNRVRVTLTVNSDNVSQCIFDKLASVGRYELNAGYSNGRLTLTMPNMTKQVIVNDEVVNEYFVVEVQVPYDRTDLLTSK